MSCDLLKNITVTFNSTRLPLVFEFPWIYGMGMGIVICPRGLFLNKYDKFKWKCVKHQVSVIVGD